jgi:hypothetical protein
MRGGLVIFYKIFLSVKYSKSFCKKVKLSQIKVLGKDRFMRLVR